MGKFYRTAGSSPRTTVILRSDVPYSMSVYDRIVCLPSWQNVDVKQVVAAVTCGSTKGL